MALLSGLDALSQQRESFFEKLLRATAGSAVAAAKRPFEGEPGNYCGAKPLRMDSLRPAFAGKFRLIRMRWSLGFCAAIPLRDLRARRCRQPFGALLWLRAPALWPNCGLLPLPLRQDPV